MIRLYDYVLSPSCYKVRLLLAILGVPYEPVLVDFYPGREHKSLDFREINPLGELPVLEDGDLRLRDAQAILVYLARRYDASGRWCPTDPATLGTVMMWLAFAGRELMSIAKARAHDMLGQELDIARARAAAHAALRVLDDALQAGEAEGRLWLAADHPTVADLAAFPFVAMAPEGGIDHQRYGAIWRWLDRVKAIPGFVTMPGILPLYQERAA